MSKKDFIALADMMRGIRAERQNSDPDARRLMDQTECGKLLNLVETRLADFCQEQNPTFKRERWLQYIAGECGPNGGAIRKERAA